MASRLGLGRPGSFAAPARLLAAPARQSGLGLAVPRLARSRHDGNRRNKALENLHREIGKSRTPTTTRTDSAQVSNVVLLNPYTLVTEPLRKYITRPLRLLSVLKAKLVRFASDYASLISVSLSSKPSFLGRRKFKPNNAKVVLAAKAMHREYYDALARANMAALSKVTTQAHGTELAGVISRRPKARRFRWELVRYTKPMVYPRIVDQKMWQLMATLPMTRQVVVAISSVQRLVELDGVSGAVVSEKVTEKLENMMMVCHLDRYTWEQSDWKVHGFLEPMTLETYEETRRLNDRAVMEQES